MTIPPFLYMHPFRFLVLWDQAVFSFCIWLIWVSLLSTHACWSSQRTTTSNRLALSELGCEVGTVEAVGALCLHWAYHSLGRCWAVGILSSQWGSLHLVKYTVTVCHSFFPLKCGQFLSFLVIGVYHPLSVPQRGNWFVSGCFFGATLGGQKVGTSCSGMLLILRFMSKSRPWKLMSRNLLRPSIHRKKKNILKSVRHHSISGALNCQKQVCNPWWCSIMWICFLRT